MEFTGRASELAEQGQHLAAVCIQLYRRCMAGKRWKIILFYLKNLRLASA